MQEAVLSVGEGGFSFEQLMEVCGYLPEDSGIRTAVWKCAVKAANTFDEVRMVYENMPDDAEVETGMLNMMINTAGDFDRAEEAYLHCCVSGYCEGVIAALSRMLGLATTRQEVENVYVHTPKGSEIEAIARKRLNSMQPN